MSRGYPTKKQKQVFDKVMNQDMPVSRAMLEVGYSKNTAINPSDVTRTKGWEKLLETVLPDKLLIKVHKEGLGAGERLIVGGKKTNIFKPDYSVRHKYLDTAYKIKNKFPKTEGPSVALQVNFNDNDLQ